MYSPNPFPHEWVEIESDPIPLTRQSLAALDALLIGLLMFSGRVRGVRYKILKREGDTTPKTQKTPVR